MTKVKVYCSKCGDLINEIELFTKMPETLKNHIICRNCYNKGKERDKNESK